MRRPILIITLAIVLAPAAVSCGGSNGYGNGSAPATAAPGASVPANASDRGAQVWRSYCAGCHAQDPAAVGVADAAAVQRVVENGAGDMPGFAGKLPAAGIKAVSRYVAEAAQ
jgi:mono/diheme cytochrome c family protein